MSLLSICTNAANNIGIAAPSSIIGNTDPAARRLLQMARREGQVLSTRANWIALVVQHIFVADGTSDYQLPSDFRSLINDTMWDRSRFWKMRGPMTPQQWQLYKSGIIGRATIERRWRLRIPSGDPAGATANFELDPSITETTSIFVYEYVSKNLIRSATAFSAVGAAIYGTGTDYTIGDVITLAGGTFTEATQLVVTGVSTEIVYLTDGNGNILTDGDGNYLTMPPNPIISVEIVPSGGRYTVVPSNPVLQASTTGSGVGATFNITWAGATQSDWQADSDTSLLDEDLIELGVIWRTMRRLGLAYDEELNEYNNQVSQAVARDGGTGTLSLVPINRLSLISPWQVQEGSFPGT